jgi:hypothetical protein
METIQQLQQQADSEGISLEELLKRRRVEEAQKKGPIGPGARLLQANQEMAADQEKRVEAGPQKPATGLDSVFSKVKGFLSGTEESASAAPASQAEEKKPEPLKNLPPPPKQPELPAPKQQAGGFSTLEKKAQTVKGPQDVDGLLAELKTYKDELPADRQKFYDEQLQKLQSDKQQLFNAYREDRRTLDWARLGETFAKAIAKLGAAWQGLKTGVDMSGVKFDPIDWSQDYQSIRDELKTSLDLTGEQQQSVKERRGEEVKAVAKGNDQLRDVLVRDFFEKRRAEAGLREAQVRANASAEKSASKEDSAAKRKAGGNILALESAMENLDSIERGELTGAKKKQAIQTVQQNMVKAGVPSEAINQVFTQLDESDGWFSSPDYSIVKNYLKARRDSLKQLVGEDQAFASSEAAGEASDAPPPPPQGMVRMIAPDGKPGLVPASQVEAAKAKGARLAQ